MDKQHRWIEVGHKFSRTHHFNEDQVRAFALAAGDTNPIHHDTEAAANSPYRRLIASGTHTSALILGLTASHFSENYAVVGVAFSVEMLRPVFADATVRIEWEVVGATMKSDHAQKIELRGGIYDAGGQKCLHATGVVRISPKP